MIYFRAGTRIADLSTIQWRHRELSLRVAESLNIPEVASWTQLQVSSFHRLVEGHPQEGAPWVALAPKQRVPLGGAVLTHAISYGWTKTTICLT